jgi:hypothetical protein
MGFMDVGVMSEMCLDLRLELCLEFRFGYVLIYVCNYVWNSVPVMF